MRRTSSGQQDGNTGLQTTDVDGTGGENGSQGQDKAWDCRLEDLAGRAGRNNPAHQGLQTSKPNTRYLGLGGGLQTARTDTGRLDLGGSLQNVNDRGDPGRAGLDVTWECQTDTGTGPEPSVTLTETENKSAKRTRDLGAGATNGIYSGENAKRHPELRVLLKKTHCGGNAMRGQKLEAKSKLLAQKLASEWEIMKKPNTRANRSKTLQSCATKAPVERSAILKQTQKGKSGKGGVESGPGSTRERTTIKRHLVRRKNRQQFVKRRQKKAGNPAHAQTLSNNSEKAEEPVSSLYRVSKENRIPKARQRRVTCSMASVPALNDDVINAERCRCIWELGVPVVLVEPIKLSPVCILLTSINTTIPKTHRHIPLVQQG